VQAPQIDKLTISEIREYRATRIVKIKKGETPKPLDNNNELSKIVFHLVPIKAFAPSMIFNLSGLQKDLNSVKPIYSSVWNGRYNFEGFFIYGHSLTNASGSIGSYVQVFHNGIIEAVDLRLLLEGYIEGPVFTQGLTEALIRYLSCQQKLGVEPPIFAILSMIKVQGFKLIIGRESFGSQKFDKEDLLFSELQIDDFNPDPNQALKPLFDMVWNAAGLPESSY
jgi:hypothetical protein